MSDDITQTPEFREALDVALRVMAEQFIKSYPQPGPGVTRIRTADLEELRRRIVQQEITIDRLRKEIREMRRAHLAAQWQCQRCGVLGISIPKHDEHLCLWCAREMGLVSATSHESAPRLGYIIQHVIGRGDIPGRIRCVLPSRGHIVW